MRLKVPKVDGRTDVLDLDTGRSVGFVLGRQGTIDGTVNRPPCPSWHISLFDGKYAASFQRHDECRAFAKGVEAVLSHMVSTGDHRSSEQKPTSSPAA
jgi:hypothetical protein